MASIDRSPTHLLHRASQAVELLFAMRVRSSSLTPRQLAVLLTVEAQEGLSQTDVMEVTGIDRSTTANIVRRLLRNGFLQRRRSTKDARAYSVKLTGEGRRVLHTVMPLAMRVDQRVLDVLPSERREAFLSALAAIVGTLEGSLSS